MTSDPGGGRETAVRLRTLVHGVIGLTQLLEESALEDAERRLVTALGSEARALHQLADELLGLDGSLTHPPRRERRGRVLVIEDNGVNQKLISAQLGRLGYSATVASSAEDGLELLTTEDFDAVLVDWQLPGMDGLAATGRIRELQAGGSLRAGLPVVGITANAMAGDRQRCLAAGMDEVLAKPIALADLSSALDRFLRPGAVQLVDEGALAALVDELDPETVAAAVRIFLEEAPQRRLALRSDAPELVARAAHTFKGSARMLGCEPLAEACARLDDAGRSTEPMPALVRTLAEDVERILDDTIEALERWGDNAGASAHAVADAAHRADV